MPAAPFIGAILLAAIVAASSTASAQEDLPSPTFGSAASAAALNDMRGGADTYSNQMSLQGTTGGNTADHVVTGNNSIGQGSFSGMSGIPLVVQNSGANVLIQNAVIVNVRME